MKSVLAFAKKQLLPALLCFVVAFAIDRTILFKKVDNVVLDELTKLRRDLQWTVPENDLALIGIDEISLASIGHWPFNRQMHGDLMQLIGIQRPSVVAWDIMFFETTPEDSDFVAGILKSGATVILGAALAEGEEGTKPDDPAVKDARLKPLTKITGDPSKILSSETIQVPVGALGQTAEIGFVDAPPGVDGVRRSAPLMVRVGKQVYPTLSLSSLMEYWRAEPANVEVRLGDAIIIDAPLAKRRIPIDETGAYRINYRHSLEGYNLYGYSAVRGATINRYVTKIPDADLPRLTGRIVLIGQVAQGLSDFGPTPFSPLTPLMLVHANIIENVLRQDYVHVVRPWTIWFGAFAFGMIGLVKFSDRKLREQAVFSLGIPTAFGMVAAFVWVNGSWLMPVVGPMTGFFAVQVFMIGRRVLAEQRAKEQIKGMFGAYLSPALITRMIDSGQMPTLGGHDAEITAYFSDIQGFSSFSEKLASGPLVELMNEYLTACTDIVQSQGGTLDKYIGDAVVAMFGAPIPMTDHAFRACIATQLVHLKLAELRKKWESEGDKWPQIVWKMQSRIGLNSGVCMIGNMGSRTRFNYTMMGDNVNLAARMESGAKQYGVYTMVTETTKQACEQHGGDRLVFRYLDKIVVKGRSIPVPIYEVVGLKENVTDRTRECLGIFQQGIEKYLAQDWDGAEARFKSSTELEPNVPGKTPGVEGNPSLSLIARCHSMREHPPGPDWDGVFHMKEK